MKFNQKLIMLAKGVGVWWGIYLILGCCAGFVLKTLRDMFFTDVQFRVILFIPFMCGGSLLLAIITYIINSVLKRAPVKKLRRKLVNIFKTEGFSSNYINLLFENARDDRRNLMIIEAAAAYCLRGETDNALKTLEQADLTSITDIAESTGDFSTPAYYYCVKMAAYITAKNRTCAVEAYDDGSYYLDAFSDSDPVMTVLALYQTEGGLHDYAIETISKVKWRILPRAMRKYGKGFSEFIKAKNLLAMGKYSEAETAARLSMENSCTEYISAVSEEIVNEAMEKAMTEESSSGDEKAQADEKASYTEDAETASEE